MNDSKHPPKDFNLPNQPPYKYQEIHEAILRLLSAIQSLKDSRQQIDVILKYLPPHLLDRVYCRGYALSNYLYKKEERDHAKKLEQLVHPRRPSETSPTKNNVGVHDNDPVRQS